MINGWNILNILSPGTSANSFGLPTNCYFCTAAALRNMDCNELVGEAQVMQENSGGADKFTELFNIPLVHKEYDTYQSVINALLIGLNQHEAVAVGYNRTNGTGHMIVVFKSQVKVLNDGSTVTPEWGNLRHIDYQTQSADPFDGILAGGDDAAFITRYHIFHR